MFGLSSLLNWRKKAVAPSTEGVMYPPIVMRLYKSDTLKEVPAVPGREFMFKAWRYDDEFNALTTVVTKLVHKAAAYFGDTPVKMISLQLHDDYLVCASQLKTPSGIQPHGSVSMFLYISSNDVDIRFGKDDSLYGVFTQDFMKILTHIAIRFNCILTGVQTTKDGDIMAMYMPHDPKYDLETYFNRYYNSDTWMAPEGDHGTVDHSDKPT